MKRSFTLLFCLFTLQIVKADSSFLPATFLHGGKGDTAIVPVVNRQVPFTYQGGIIKRRLDSITKDVPMDYNESVQGYIDIYSHNREEMGHVLGLSKYYFPIYEKAFRDAGIPEEIKYLSIIESKLDPNATSRVGAAGPWQFMSATAKMYGLSMDDYVDDRRDPIQASYAAAAYLKDAYQEFGDWLLAIAAYNSGKSNVEHAIERANATDYWSIRQYLPVETRNYVPAFIAVSYVMNYYKRHNIIPQACNISLKTDTVLVNKYVSLGTVSNALGVTINDLAVLNPAYKRQIINGTTKAPRRLVIPQIDKGRYGALYAALNSSGAVVVAPQAAYTTYQEPKAEKVPLYHTVKRGETLADIADMFGIEVIDLKSWNHLHSNKAVVGQKLRLKEPGVDSKEKLSAAGNTARINKG